MFEEAWGQWSWAGYLLCVGVLIYQVRQYENAELEANLGFERARNAGMSEIEIAVRRLNSIEKWLKAATLSLICLIVIVVAKS